jgi:hypothetical protein
MTRNDTLDQIISGLHPQDVPIEFIVMATITDRRGKERVIRGDEITEVFEDPYSHGVTEAKIIYNIKKMRKLVIAEVESIYDQVADLLQAEKR